MEDLASLLRRHPFLDGLKAEQVAFLTGCAKNVRFAPGAFLFREGELAETLFLIREGRVGLEMHHPSEGPIRVEMLQPGDIAGWSWLFPPYRWHLDGRALDPVRAFQLDGKCLREKLERDHELGYAITRRLLEQAHRRLERVRLQRLDLYRKEAVG